MPDNRRPSGFGLLFFVIVLFCSLVLPALFMDGMFNDGIFYAAISRNFAEGYGSLWNMYFSETHYKSMHEQPPLMFVLQAGFFKIFGSTFYTERIYCVVTAAINVYLVIRAWKLIHHKEEDTRLTSWLPVLLWIVMPVTFYAFTNNIEECTMTIFVMLAFNSILKGVFIHPDSKSYWLWAGFWILAAGLTKGIQGMFLLSAPFWCWVFLERGNFKKIAVRTGLIMVIPILFVLVACLTPEIRNSFEAYFASRFGKTFSHETATSSHHFHLLYELLIDMLPTLAIMSVFFIAGRKIAGFLQSIRSQRETICFVLACAFSGILPLLVTREQRGFYLVTALPMVAIACALCIRIPARRLSHFIGTGKNIDNMLTVFSCFFLGIVLFITIQQAGKPKRDAEKIEALKHIAAITGERVTIRTSPSIFYGWPLVAYAQRYHGLSFTDKDFPYSEWLLVEKGTAVPAAYKPQPIPSALYDLYSK